MKRKIGAGKIEAWKKPSKLLKERQSQDNKICQESETQSAVKIIPPKSVTNVQTDKKLRVAAYCRVSTKADDQISSYENQKNHYLSYIEKNPEWEFAGIYADRGFSGTAMKNRTNLLRMIEDCKAGKIDRVITKSVERFSRNAVECLNTVDELLAIKSPVPVVFEVDGFDSAKHRYEMDFQISVIFAQNDSVKKSRLVKWGFKVRFQSGKALVPTHCFLGYDKDIAGNIVIVPKEAKVVRFIYNSYLSGMCAAEIADELTKANIPTTMGGNVWNPSVILNMLRNEKYVGDALMQKTYTPNCLSHKAVRNDGQIEQYYRRNHHAAIIPRREWDEVQRQLPLRRYKKRVRTKPAKRLAVKRIKSGIFEGFSVINPNWNKAETIEFVKQIRKEGENNNDGV